jgi:hypothetical protein
MSFASVVRFIIGAAFGLACALALSPALAALVSEDGQGTAPTLAFAVIILGAAFLAAFAPTMRRAFGRGFLLLGASALALPLSSRVAHDMLSAAPADTQGATAIGAGMAGVVVTGIATFVGLILGLIFLVAGLVLSLGGRREVAVYSRASARQTRGGVEPAAPSEELPHVKVAGHSLGGVRRD